MSSNQDTLTERLPVPKLAGSNYSRWKLKIVRQRSHGHRIRMVRASEYRNLRQVVPALRRQRDIGKVELVTEAARYIDHLHKTLIERFVLCGIPDSLKGK